MKKILLLTTILITILLSACTNKQLSSNETLNTTLVETSEETMSVKQVVETTVKETEAKEIEVVETIIENANKIEIKEEKAIEMVNNKEVLVVYFSATGTTKRVAERIAELTNADIYEIVALNPYSSADLNWNDSNSITTIEMNDENARPEIGSEDIDISAYAKIYIGYPIWWGDAPRIMSTFVEKHNFDGMTVIPFCTSGGSGIGRSGSNLAGQAGSGNWQNGERLSSSSVDAFVERTK